MISSKPLLVLFSLLAVLGSGRSTWAFSAAESPPADGVQWRRTAEGWERADGWLVEVQVGQARDLAPQRRASPARSWISLHPALFAALQLCLSCAALAIFRPKYVRKVVHVERRRPHFGRPHVRSPEAKV